MLVSDLGGPLFGGAARRSRFLLGCCSFAPWSRNQKPLWLSPTILQKCDRTSSATGRVPLFLSFNTPRRQHIFVVFPLPHRAAPPSLLVEPLAPGMVPLLPGDNMFCGKSHRWVAIVGWTHHRKTDTVTAEIAHWTRSLKRASQNKMQLVLVLFATRVSHNHAIRNSCNSQFVLFATLQLTIRTTHNSCYSQLVQLAIRATHNS